MGASICAFTAICEEDRCWIPQYLREIERLDISFVVLFDRVSPETKYRMLASPRCLGHVARYADQGEFTETAKQPLLDLISPWAFNWALAWDIDETFETDFMSILGALDLQVDQYQVRWLNLWDNASRIRVDGAWARGHRVKLLNLTGARKWKFDHPITNGPKLVAEGRETFHTGVIDAVCLHHGMMTPELRRMHKERWDRIYSTALRGDANPYGFWKYAIETEAEAVTVKHGY